MSTQITCPSCGTKGIIPDEAQGRQIKCPNCKSVVSAQESPVLYRPPGGVPPTAKEDKASPRSPDLVRALERLEQLEKRYQGLNGARGVFLFVLAIILPSLTIAVCLLFLRVASAESQQGAKSPSLEAQKFILRDPNGSRRAGSGLWVDAKKSHQKVGV